MWSTWWQTLPLEWIASGSCGEIVFHSWSLLQLVWGKLIFLYPATSFFTHFLLSFVASLSAFPMSFLLSLCFTAHLVSSSLFCQSFFGIINSICLEICLSVVLHFYLFFALFLSYSILWTSRWDIILVNHFGVCPVFSLTSSIYFFSSFAENPVQGLDTHKSQSSANRQCPSLTMLWPHLLIQGEAVALTNCSLWLLGCFCLSLTTVPFLFFLTVLHSFFSCFTTSCLYLCNISVMHSAFHSLNAKKSVNDKFIYDLYHCLYLFKNTIINSYLKLKGLFRKITLPGHIL